MPRLFLGMLAVLGSLVGCGSEPTSESPSRSVAGRWVLRLLELTEDSGYVNAAVALIEVDNNGSAKVLAETKYLPRPKIQSVQIDGDSLHLVLVNSRGKIDFRGRLSGEVIRGNVNFGGFRVEPAWMEATDKTRIYSSEEALPADGLEELAAAEQSADRFAAGHSFARQNPKWPISVKEFRRLSGMLGEQELPPDEVTKFVADYVATAEQWGQRMAAFAHFDAGWELVRQGRHTTLGLEHLRNAEREMTPSMLDAIRPNLVAAYQRGEAIEAFHQADAGSADALAKLQTLRAAEPFNPHVLYLAAEAARRHGDTETALQRFAELTVWPMFENTVYRQHVWQEGDRVLPRSHLLQLWVSRRGSEAGREEFQQSVYQHGLELFHQRTTPPKLPVDGQRIVLVELFTGAQCPPCVAADVATNALEEQCPRTQLVVLRYHQHVPGPDPLANEHGLRRFMYYEGQQTGTPMIAVDGQVTAFLVGGGMDRAAEVHGQLRNVIESASRQPTDVRLDLTATLEGDRVQTSAKLQGLPTETDDLRLFLVLAEDAVQFTAENGIRRHDLLARWVLGDMDGLPIVGETLSPVEKPTLEELRRRLRDQLAKAETAFETEFEVQPLELKPLWLVGFVQNVKTKQILQTAAVPLSLPEPSAVAAPMSELPPLPTEPAPAVAEKPSPATAEEP